MRDVSELVEAAAAIEEDTLWSEWRWSTRRKATAWTWRATIALGAAVRRARGAGRRGDRRGGAGDREVYEGASGQVSVRENGNAEHKMTLLLAERD